MDQVALWQQLFHMWSRFAATGILADCRFNAAR
jgi:hypothetical protein